MFDFVEDGAYITFLVCTEIYSAVSSGMTEESGLGMTTEKISKAKKGASARRQGLQYHLHVCYVYTSQLKKEMCTGVTPAHE